MTDALVQFIRARLDEDGAAARAATGRGKGSGSWTVEEMAVRAADGAPVLRHTWAGEGEHIARHDPERVLRELVAKRLMLDEALASGHHVSADQYETCPRATKADGLDAAQMDALTGLNDEQRQESGREPTCWDSCGRDARVHRTLELLALPFVGHPDYMQALLADRA
ncbi:DUF6221 family protein [Streptomyces poriferorum]|uniref:DUF6221 family protein n=1 Tax=Streptomyces poriferorum TaxID=2798799 RepID=A0ABY9IZN7_9ACTN|nr:MULTISPECIES: DUF6221 family protein [unclassified Streptomyces]MDP5310416.1 DUF6221 family protein [Streptomyces sp. Alt4]WLQ60430.1 DUF6221 family protein [Streptomyces sp. Alt2]